MLPAPKKTADLVTFTEEIFYGKLHLLCSNNNNNIWCIVLIGYNRRRLECGDVQRHNGVWRPLL